MNPLGQLVQHFTNRVIAIARHLFPFMPNYLGLKRSSTFHKLKSKGKSDIDNFNRLL